MLSMFDMQSTYTKLEKDTTFWVPEISYHYKHTNIRYLLDESTIILGQGHLMDK